MAKRAFSFSDEKSDKFWWIDFDGLDFVVNYGRAGTNGRFQVKEFDSEEDCKKEAEKMIAQKIKKGYIEEANFDFDNRFYFDDEEIGLHRKTSHPNFQKHFTHELYLDCGDEEAPFGSDEGSDTLVDMQELVKKKGWIDFSLYPQSLIENVWDMKYIPSADMDADAVKALIAEDEMNLIQSDMVTYASAFAQIKITGYVNKELNDRALLAIKRIDIVAKIQGWMKEDAESEISKLMISDSSSYDKYK